MTRVRCVLLGLLVMAVPACGGAKVITKSQGGSAALEKGIQAFDRADYDLAISFFNDAIAQDPGQPLAFANRGRAYAAKGMHDLAIADFSAELKHDPKNKLVYVSRSLSYAHNGQDVEAEMDCARAAEAGPGEPDPHAQLAGVYGERGQQHLRKRDYPRAAMYFRNALRHAPKQPAYHMGLGAAEGGCYRWDEAIQSLQAAKRLGWKSTEGDPALALAYLGRAKRNLDEGRDKQAVADIDEAVRLDPAVRDRARGIHELLRLRHPPKNVEPETDQNKTGQAAREEAAKLAIEKESQAQRQAAAERAEQERRAAQAAAEKRAAEEARKKAEAPALAEKAAAAALRLIKESIALGKLEGFALRSRLDRFIKQYPDTAAAVEAREILKKHQP